MLLTMANLWTMLGSADARLVFTALDELKKEAVAVQKVEDVADGRVLDTMTCSGTDPQ